MQLLSNSEINNFCRRAAGLSFDLLPGWTSPQNITDSYLSDLFLNLYNTGLRFVEAFEIIRWSEIATDTYYCDTAKNSNNRTFNASELTSLFINAIKSQVNIYDFCRYTTTNNWLSRVFLPYELYLTGKRLMTHVFRHNKVKQMFDADYTLAEIQTYIGEVSQSNVLLYVNSNIYKK